jgi:hypothetical protein
MEILGLPTTARSIILVGDYGSGKTEIAVNLALLLATHAGARRVAIADLDLVNPYFRCREAIEPLERAGLRVVVPEGGHRFADLPILMPQVKGLLQDTASWSILDVGGDEAGSRVLANLASAFAPSVHELWFVVNANRPFNDTPDGCVRTVRRIEASTHLRVTGLVPNTHLMEETTTKMVMDGVALANDVAALLAVPVRLVAAMESVVASIDDDAFPVPLLRMRRIMVPPWVRRDEPRTGPDAFRPRVT